MWVCVDVQWGTFHFRLRDREHRGRCVTLPLPPPFIYLYSRTTAVMDQRAVEKVDGYSAEWQFILEIERLEREQEMKNLGIEKNAQIESDEVEAEVYMKRIVSGVDEEKRKWAAIHKCETIVRPIRFTSYAEICHLTRNRFRPDSKDCAKFEAIVESSFKSM